jgi:glutathionyl-hydroquinone reductase
MSALDLAGLHAEELAADGAFRRKSSRFRDFVSDGEAGRYHLYVSSACPWAHRVVIYRMLKGLDDAISMTIVDPERDQRGWAITSTPGTTPDAVNGYRFLAEAYAASAPATQDHVTVPVLWDIKQRRIVNNESSEIIRMLDGSFDAVARNPLPRLCPDDLRRDIDELNSFVYDTINDGVYRCGFAASQAVYDSAFGTLFDALDTIDARLADQRFLLGDRPTESDWRLFPTLVRFDAVYHGLFKCNLRRVADYPNLSGYLRDLYQQPGIAATVNIDHIKRHYYRTLPFINPTRIVPRGPHLDFAAAHDRDRLATTPR